MHRLAFAFASVLVLASAAPAFAAEQASNVTQVSIDDIDVNTPAGADAALNRIRRATRDDCGIDDQRNIDIGIYALLHSCVKEGVSSQIDRLGSPVLRARYEQRNGG